MATRTGGLWSSIVFLKTSNYRPSHILSNRHFSLVCASPGVFYSVVDQHHGFLSKSFLL